MNFPKNSQYNYTMLKVFANALPTIRREMVGTKHPQSQINGQRWMQLATIVLPVSSYTSADLFCDPTYYINLKGPKAFGLIFPTLRYFNHTKSPGSKL